MTFTYLTFGLVLLAVGGDILVRSAVGIAKEMRVSPLFTGLVLVGFGTSLPELVASIVAITNGSSALVVGNIFGSNIANVLLILGVTALIMSIPADPKAFSRDAPVLTVATIACMAAAYSGTIGRLVGFFFFYALITYLFYTYSKESVASDESAELHKAEADIVDAPTTSLPVLTFLFIGGMAAIVLGAHWTVTSSITVARMFEIPETIIGLTLVAVGTSLPELATSVAAAIRRHTDVAFGNIIGSNLFNILGILGITALVKPIIVPPGALTYDIWILGGVTALLILFAFTDRKISRFEGATFLALYVAYMALLVYRVT